VSNWLAIKQHVIAAMLMHNSSMSNQPLSWQMMQKGVCNVNDRRLVIKA
jgi:hypothetical protein